jgi:hypothetical protein
MFFTSIQFFLLGHYLDEGIYPLIQMSKFLHPNSLPPIYFSQRTNFSYLNSQIIMNLDKEKGVEGRAKFETNQLLPLYFLSYRTKTWIR